MLALTLVCQTVDQPGIGVEIEDNGLVIREEGRPLADCQTVGMLAMGNQLKEIDHVDESDLELGEVFAQQSSGSKRLHGWYVAARGHDHVGLFPLVVGCPIPDSDTFGTVLDGSIHVEVLKMLLLICHDNVDVVAASETVICDREESICIRR